MFQSTHPHGVRRFLWRIPKQRISFNPRTHMGCDAVLNLDTFRLFQFQSTHPHGVRLEGLITTLTITGFNPRTHMGCDHIE